MKKIEGIIVKFLMNEANEEELDKLEEWLEDESNVPVFDNYIKTNYAFGMNINEFNSENVKKALVKKIKEDKHIIYRVKAYRLLKYAAVAVIFCCIGYFISKENLNTSNDITPVVVDDNLESGTNKATLTLEDGSEIVLEKGASFKTQSANSNGEEIVYEAKKQNSKEAVYNYLTIPRGGEFSLQLSDGTKVWLNSETQLKYPISFIEGEPRMVELVYGEAYFEVSPSTAHNGAKFKVVNNAQEVQVLGTKFNIKAYEDESNIYTTLVEGTVKVNTPTEKRIMKPNQQLNVDILNNEVTVSEVDIKTEIAWIHGDFVFKRAPLKEIMKVLSRWYDVDIEVQNKSLEYKRFHGELSKYQNLEDILILIQNTNYINAYEINDKKIILK